MTLKRRKTSTGFTMMEVVIAIMILAGSLTTLLGLQSAVTKRSIQDRIREVAMLSARRIFTALEKPIDPPAIGTYSGTLDEILAQLMPIERDAAADQKDIDPLLDRLQGQLNISGWQLPEIDGDVMKRVELEVIDTQDNSRILRMIYFIPFDEGGNSA